jgi:glutamyl-tRNA synthetase
MTDSTQSVAGKPIVTRFAPSPTGYLHVGGARTALFNWLMARNAGGRFLLRIEDTDLARSTDDACRQLLEDLKWLGLEWDNAELVYQSKRLELYNGIIAGLMDKGLAYEAWESGAELTALRAEAEKRKRAFIYKRQHYTADQISQFKAEGKRPVIRFVMPVKEYRFHDMVLGKEVIQPANECQDFVIRKADGMPTYHFGVVVDDQDMGITHVMRGLEHLKNTFLHIALQEALGYERPVFAHLSVMLNPETGEKLSKRDRDRRIRRRTQEVMRSTKKSVEDLSGLTGVEVPRLSEWLAKETVQLDLAEQPKVMKAVGLKEADLPEIMIHDFRKNGYVPEVLLNFLALQGWSAGGDREKFTIPELTAAFSIDRINSANPKFNREKLKSFSTDFYAAASPERLLAAMRDYLAANPQSPLIRATDEQLAKVLKMNSGFHVLSEVDEKSRFMFVADNELVYEKEAVDKTLLKNDGQGLTSLKWAREAMAAVEPFDHATTEAAVRVLCEAKGVNLGRVAQPIRVAVCGITVSPPIFDCLAFIGKASVLARMDRCIALCG